MLKKEDLKGLVNDSNRYSVLNYHVLESMADWVRVVDNNGNVIYANKAMKEALGSNIINEKCYSVHGSGQPCGFCISKRSMRTLETVQKEELIGDRHFSVKSSPVLNDEGHAIAAVEVFRDVTRERRLENELIEKNKKMSNDLNFAKRLQRRILPKKGDYMGLAVDHLYMPSEMLSGDMYDVYSIDEDNIGIYICDVVGHGVTASMMTMFVRQTMRAIKDEIASPGEALTELQKRFISLNLEIEKYFTIFYAVYNTRTRELKYSNAGHNCIPIMYNKRELNLLKSTGFPISLLFNEIYYKENSIVLDLEDRVLFYTDGITEVKNFEGMEFGIERLASVVEEHREKEDIIDQIIDNVERFRWGEQEDDFAMILIEIKE